MPTADFQQCQIIILMSAAEPSQLIYPSENHGKLELEKSRRVGYRSGSLFFFFFFFFPLFSSSSSSSSSLSFSERQIKKGE